MSGISFLSESGVSNNEPLLVDDLVLGSTQQGNAFAVERLTGHVRWIAALADDAGGDAGYPNAHEGIFVVSAHKRLRRNCLSCMDCFLLDIIVFWIYIMMWRFEWKLSSAFFVPGSASQLFLG